MKYFSLLNVDNRWKQVLKNRTLAINILKLTCNNWKTCSEGVKPIKFPRGTHILGKSTKTYSQLSFYIYWQHFEVLKYLWNLRQWWKLTIFIAEEKGLEEREMRYLIFHCVNGRSKTTDSILKCQVATWLAGWGEEGRKCQ